MGELSLYSAAAAAAAAVMQDQCISASCRPCWCSGYGCCAGDGNWTETVHNHFNTSQPQDQTVISPALHSGAEPGFYGLWVTPGYVSVYDHVTIVTWAVLLSGRTLPPKSSICVNLVDAASLDKGPGVPNPWTSERLSADVLKTTNIIKTAWLLMFQSI